MQTVDPDSLDPMWLALATALVALIVNALLVVRVIRAFTAGRRTLDAAMSLIDVHVDAVATQALDTVHRSGAAAAAGTRLAEAVSRLGASAAELRYLVGVVPRRKEELRRALLDLVLPTPRDFPTR